MTLRGHGVSRGDTVGPGETWWLQGGCGGFKGDMMAPRGHGGSKRDMGPGVMVASGGRDVVAPGVHGHSRGTWWLQRGHGDSREDMAAPKPIPAGKQIPKKNQGEGGRAASGAPSPPVSPTQN